MKCQILSGKIRKINNLSSAELAKSSKGEDESKVKVHMYLTKQARTRKTHKIEAILFHLYSPLIYSETGGVGVIFPFHANCLFVPINPGLTHHLDLEVCA